MKSATLRSLCALAVRHDLEIDQIDVCTAFLYGKLEEEHEIYMRQPAGYIEPGSEHKVCRLLKGLYGLKQAGRAWNQCLNAELIKIGFTRSEEDHCLYMIGTGDEVVAIGVHVDDSAIVGRRREIAKIKTQVQNVFEITDGGALQYFLGLEFERNREKRQLVIHQSRYTTELLQRHQMDTCAPKSTPWDSGVKLTKEMSPGPADEEEQAVMADVPYRTVVGELLFLSISTRPDISHAVGQLARFVANPGLRHWAAAKRVLRYLNGTRSLGISFDGNQPLELLGYADADWAGSEERRSTSGYIFTYGGGAISWRSQRQPTVALSTMEAEYMSLSTCTQQAVWLRRLLTELDGRLGTLRESSESGPTRIMEDNQACIQFAKDPKDHTRAKHIAIRFHFVRECILTGEVRVDYCHTNQMLADLLTKEIASNQFRALLRKMGMRDCRN
jgi:hypothetical protein